MNTASAPGYECLCCAGGTAAEHFEVPETLFGFPGLFRYAACAACGSLQLTEVPEDLGRFYPSDYFSFAARPSMKPRGRLAPLLARALLSRQGVLQSAIVRARSPSWADWFVGLGVRLDEPVLDVGSGSGGLLLHLASYGFSNLTGVDPFVPADVDHGNGVRIRKARLAELSGSYRVILFNHSLEHSPVPLEQLGAARSLLAREGRLVIRIPLVGGSFRRHGAAFVGLEEAPRHVFVPSVAGVSTLAERAGFRLERVIHDGNAHHVLVSERRAHHGLGPSRERRVVASRYDRMRAALTARRQNRSGAGDTATFLFRRAERPEAS